jgi:raffinose/stachyose/melibiose transport system substrate-binding protein
MKKKTLSLFLALVLSLSLLAGCGGGDEPGNQPSDNKEPSTAQQPSDSQPADDQPGDSGKQYDGVNLTMWSMWNSDEPQGKVIQEAVAAFEEQTGAKISVEWKGRSVNEILSASLESGEKFDIFEDDYQRIANIYKDFTYDLTDMAAAVNYDSFSYACFNDTVKEWAGFLNSIAEQPQVGGIFYDKDAFSKAGVTAEPKTWTEFLDVCQKLKDAGIAPIAQDSAYADFAFYHQLVRHLGEDAITELDANGGWADSEGAVAAAQEIIDLRNAGYFADGAPDEYPSSQNKIGFGQAAMIVCANYVTAEVNNATGSQINWGLFNYPSVEGGAEPTAAYAGTNSLAITKYSENPQAAFDFIMFLTTGEFDQKMADTAAQIPADARNTAPSHLSGTIETLLSADSPMTWCNGFNARDDLKTSLKSTIVELYEGKFATGADFCKAVDALY